MPTFRNEIYDALLFDMDGTMVDSTSVVERVWGAWARRHDIDPAVLVPTIHGVRARDTIARFGGTRMDVEAELDWIGQAERDDLVGIVAIEGIHAMVENLADDEWAVVTSAPQELARLRLGAVGLPVPRVLIGAEDVSSGKPDPEGFIKAAALLGAQIGDCLVFEDSPVGVHAARAAGAKVAIVGGLVRALADDHVLDDYRT